MKIAIVNDLKIEIEILRKVIEQFDDFKVIWTASNGRECIDKMKVHKPDLILMNLIMPVLDGVEATSEIMKENPVAILIVTSSVSKNQGKVFSAMGNGALDVVSTPCYDSEGNLTGADDLIKKMLTIKKLILKPTEQNSELKKTKTQDTTKSKLIAIGSSTGGPKALSFILQNLPETLDLPIVIVQHVDTLFANGFVKWLDSQTKHKVKIAEEDETIANGNIYVAGSNDHLIITGLNKFHYTPDPLDYPYRPSVDTFFYSLSNNMKYYGLAVLLTGMGNDGAKGLLKLKQTNWSTLAQDKETSVVWGMPKVAFEIGAVNEVSSLTVISKKINEFIN